jgi:hypothetical protein
VAKVCFGVVVIWASTISAPAQDVLLPPPRQFSAPAPALQSLETNQTELAASQPNASIPSAQPGPFDWGQFHLHPRVTYRSSYGDGIQSVPGQTSKTLINEFFFDLRLDMGDHWHFDYSPSLHIYSGGSLHNSFDQSLGLQWGTTYQNWTLGLGQTYGLSSAPLVQTGSQTDQETYSTSLTAGYQLNSKISFDIAASQILLFAKSVATNQPLSDRRSWSTTDGVNYELRTGLSVGLSAGFTYDDVSASSDMTSEQFQGRVNWRPGGKLALSANGGFEDRQFLNSNQPSSLNPIFGLTATYQLFAQTTLSLSGNRAVAASYFENQITETLSFSGGIHQRLLQILYFDLTGSYSTVDYQATSTTFNASRKDDHISFSASVGCSFLRHANASVFYSWSDNSSNLKGFSFTSNQIGLEVGIAY